MLCYCNFLNHNHLHSKICAFFYLYKWWSSFLVVWYEFKLKNKSVETWKTKNMYNLRKSFNFRSNPFLAVGVFKVGQTRIIPLCSQHDQPWWEEAVRCHDDEIRTKPAQRLYHACVFVFSRILLTYWRFNFFKTWMYPKLFYNYIRCLYLC